MPVEFLTDEQAAGYGRFPDVAPSQAELERFCFLDEADLRLVEMRRGDHNRLGFAVQLATVRALGTFLTDSIDVPTAVLDYVAVQVGVADPSCVKRYTERDKTRLEHQWQIAGEYGYRGFADAEPELVQWIADRSWHTGDGRKRIFDGAAAWLRERRVLLPGVSTLARLVARVCDSADQRLWETLAALLTPTQARALESLLEVSDGARRSVLDGWKRAPKTPSGKGMVTALERVAAIAAVHMSELDLTSVPHRRLVELARYGVSAKAPTIKRHRYHRRLATLVATVRWLEAKATDDALELFDVLMTNELMGRASRESSKDKLRRYPTMVKDAAKCARAAEILLEAREWGEDASIELLWDAIENTVSRAELRAAVGRLTEVVPPPDADPDGEWRAALVDRFPSVRAFVPLLCQVIEFGATADAAPVLCAAQDLLGLLDARPSKKVPAGYLDARKCAVDLIPAGWWQRLVFKPGRPEGTVDRAGYVFCILELFHQRLKRRDIFATVSARWSDPRAKLLAGAKWQQVKASSLNSLGLPENPDELLDAHSAELDSAWRHAAEGIANGGDQDRQVRLDASGRLHAEKITAIADPPSLIDLRTRCEAMLPRVDLSELILEVMSWHPQFADAFTTGLSGAETRLSDLHITVAAALTAHSLNVGYVPVISEGIPALTRARISHVDQNYLRPETFAAANAVLIDAQAGIDLAQAWGGGLVAAVDGMRFVVPVRTVEARPNPKYFGRRRGATWFNMVNDQAVGTAGQVLSGTPRDSLHLVDLIYSQDGGSRPEVIVTDTGSYSDLVFGLLQLLGFDYRPQLADLPDAKLWRISASADYGPLTNTAKGKIDLGRIRRHWPDILRAVASIHTGEVSCYDVVRVMQSSGNLTQLGDAIAHYGRIFKTLHVLTYVDDEPYRRHIKGMRNLQEGRHALAAHVFHGRKGELHRAYREGMEDQLSALGLALNCITLWNTVYVDRSLAALRAAGYPVLDADVARLSPYMRKHIRVHGHYSFQLPDLGGTHRTLRDPDAEDDD